MMLTSKQRAYLRSLAVNEDTILMMGKSGMSPELIKQADDALEKRELIKGRVLPESSPMTSREAAEEIAGRLEEIGNIHSDGRPILGLPCHDLLEILLTTCPESVYVPAHI